MQPLIHLSHDGRRLCGRAAAPDAPWQSTHDPAQVTCGSCKLSLRKRQREGARAAEIGQIAIEAMRTIRAVAVDWLEHYDATAMEEMDVICDQTAQVLRLHPCAKCQGGATLDADIECRACGRVGAA